MGDESRPPDTARRARTSGVKSSRLSIIRPGKLSEKVMITISNSPRKVLPVWLTMLGLLVSAPGVAGAEESALLGTWTVNIQRSQEIQPDNANVRWWEGLEGNFSTHVVVGGVGVPVGGGAKPEGDAGIPNPEMLRCQSFSIETNEHGLLLTYHGVGEEKIRPGAWRGLHSAWSARTLTSNYESTTRKVNRTLEIQRDGSLLMSVTINPRKGKTRRFKRVFDRKII